MIRSVMLLARSPEFTEGADRSSDMFVSTLQNSIALECAKLQRAKVCNKQKRMTKAPVKYK